MYKVQRKKDIAVYKENAPYFALKQVKIEKLSKRERENALNEVRILASINHPNVIEYKEAFIDEKSKCLCIIMENASDGDLYKKIGRHKRDRTYIKERQIWKIFIQSVKGLNAMHSINVMHRDLKSANIFLKDDEEVAKLGDMNVSKVCNSKGLNYT